MFLIYIKILKELTGIAKILNICAEKVKDHHEYLSVLCEALKICRSVDKIKNKKNKENAVISKNLFVCIYIYISLPFLKEKSSDELNYAKDATDFLSHMGT